jgi:hypothetical protein
MSDIYAPVMRVLVVAALVLATATLMLVTVSTARAADACGVSGVTCGSHSIDEPRR